MCFDRCAGGHNFDFDTDVCTRCGIDRRRYRDGGNPECVPRHIVRIATNNHLADTVPGPSTSRGIRGMKEALAIAVVALSSASSGVLAQERAGDAALGALF